MVGVFSSMLNLFWLFANIFLRLLFFLAGLIPQLLQKSQTMYNEQCTMYNAEPCCCEAYLTVMFKRTFWVG